MTIQPPSIAITDIAAALKRYPLAGTLGWQDVRQRYRRSTLGPFWLTLSMAVMIGTMGIVFGQIFKSSLTEFFPFLAAGTIFWGFISSVIYEACNGFIAAEGVIKQLPIPLFVHVLRVLWRNILILAHNLVIFPLVLLALGKPLTLLAWLSVAGFALLLLNLSWLALVLAVICARYRDLPQMVNSLIQVVFYLTPVMWMPNLLPQQTHIHWLEFNPIFHWLEIVRAPLLGYWPASNSWGVAVSMALVGWIFALLIYGRYKRRIAYWL